MAYQWMPYECNEQGTPKAKIAPAYLEKEIKDGRIVGQLFVTQEEVDEAWADGFHVVHRPETADPPRTEEPLHDKPEKESVSPPRLNKSGFPDGRYKKYLEMVGREQ